MLGNEILGISEKKEAALPIQDLIGMKKDEDMIVKVKKM